VPGCWESVATSKAGFHPRREESGIINLLSNDIHLFSKSSID
jgi:hypothetical protein